MKVGYKSPMHQGYCDAKQGIHKNPYPFYRDGRNNLAASDARHEYERGHNNYHNNLTWDGRDK